MFSGLVVGLLMLVGPWVLGGLLGRRWGSTWQGIFAAIAVGLALAAAALAAFLLTSPDSSLEACGEDECVRYFGRWLEATLAHQWPVYAVVSWTAAVLAAAIRVRRSFRLV